MRFIEGSEFRPEMLRRWVSGIQLEIANGVNVSAWMQDLSQVKRFREDPMTCQATVYDHTLRVEGLAAYFGEYLERRGVKVNQEKLLFQARHHDDPEIITGDIISPRKGAMTSDEREELRVAEERAIAILAERYFPEQMRLLYTSRYHEMEAKQSTEAQVVDIADKLDGTLETIRELRAGNERFVPIFNRYRGIIRQFQRYPVWGKLYNNPSCNLEEVPSLDDINDMPSIIVSPNDPYEVKIDGWQPSKPFWYNFSRPDM